MAEISKKTAKKRLFIVDAPGFYYRAFFAIKGNLRSPTGMPTNAIYGFDKMFAKILRDEKPDGVVITLDSKEKTFRHDMYDQYKANRQKMPEELSVQLPYIEKLINVLGVPILKRAGLEADDLIALAAEAAELAGWESVIVSADKDLMQVVRHGVQMYDPMKDKYIDSDGVVEKFGVPPELVADMLGLMGDSSDNIPGVAGVGPKTALKLLLEFGSLEGVLAAADGMKKSKLKENLINGKELAILSKRLAVITTDHPFDEDVNSWKMPEPDADAMNALYSELGFKGYEAVKKSSQPDVEKQYSIIKSKEQLSKLVEMLSASEVTGFAIDTETTSVEPMRAELLGLSISATAGVACYIPLRHSGEGSHVQLPVEDVIDALRPLLQDEGKQKYGQNIKYDYLVLRREGVDMKPLSFDTMIASYLLSAEERRHNLSHLAEKYLGYKMSEYEDVAGKGAKQIPFAEVSVAAAADYAAEDADITMRLTSILQAELKEAGMEELLYSLEMPVTKILAEMELCGIKLDGDMLREYGKELAGKLEVLEQEIYKLAGEEFNIASPKQLGVVLFERLGLKPIRKTKTGASTDHKTLEALALVHPLPEKLLVYRSLAKLQSTYVEPLPKLLLADTGRIHTSFNQATAATGRLSSSAPNLQNIPIRTEDGRKIRQAFVAEQGKLLISADYSQIELRILAHLSGDKLLTDSFNAGEDIHKRTAMEVFGAIAGASDHMRRVAKAVNFGIIYGSTGFGLSRELKIPMGEANQYIADYFARYTGVKQFIDSTRKQAGVDGFVKTMSGRMRRLPDIQSANKNIKDMAERMAVNTVVQGSAADLIKKAMIAVVAAVGSDAKLLLQVHDELILEVKEELVESVISRLTAAMTSAERLSVPLTISVSSGSNWGELH